MRTMPQVQGEDFSAASLARPRRTFPSSSGPSRGAGSPEQFAEEIANEIRELAGSVHNMVIVTSEFEDGRETYDAETELYVGLLHMVNVRISAFADLQYDLLTSRKILRTGEGERV